MDWEGLVRGTAEACSRVGLPDVREEDILREEGGHHVLQPGTGEEGDEQ